MAFKATLTIEDKTFHLLECVSTLRQKTDAKGRPVSEVIGGDIQFSVLASDNDLLTIWATDKTKLHDGVIAMYEWDQETKFKEISFKKAYVRFFSESFMSDPERDVLKVTHSIRGTEEKWLEEVHRIHSQFSTSYIFMVKISAEEINVDGIDHSNRW